MKTPAKFALTFPFLILGVFSLLFLPGTSFPQKDEYLSLKQEAEMQYIEGSFSRAHKLYLKAQTLDPQGDEARWVTFRLADSLWRSQAASKSPDTSTIDKARKQLEQMNRDILRIELHDTIWAEVEESLGDFWWQRNQSRNWHAGWRHYNKALDWWAGAKDIELARKRYLDIVWKASNPTWMGSHNYSGYYSQNVPLKVLENAIQVAETARGQYILEHQIYATNYLYAMALRHRGNIYQQEKIPEAFEKAMTGRKRSEWYDDALYHYAQWLSNSGEVIILEDGQQVRRKNYPKALKYFRKLLDEFKKGETRYFDQARQQIEQITKPQLSLNTYSIFLPDTTPELSLNWRNVSSIHLNLYAIDLSRDVDLTGNNNLSAWKSEINLNLKPKIKSWDEETQDQGDHIPGAKQILLKDKLPRGAYLLQATGGGEEARELVLVTDAALVTQTAKGKALGFFCDSVTGTPISGAHIRLFEYYHDGKRWIWRDVERTTGKDGLVVFDTKGSRYNSQYYMAASRDDRQAFVTGYQSQYHSDKKNWKIYVHTDRPAYRPKETANWKLTARTYDGKQYSTPSNETLEYVVYDPRGTKLKEGSVKLNEFGSAWDSLDLSDKVPLGEYKIHFYTKKKRRHLGTAALFRLEEYKLPEFKVSVQAPKENGKPKTFQLGDTVEVDVTAEYYFGGPVANANVELIVYQKPFHHYWRPQPDYPWYYKDMISRPNYYGGNGSQIKREVLKTDAQGKAHLTFETRRGGQDLVYKIEARVTDASRREVIASDNVKVTRQPYYVYLKNKHNLHKPQDKVQVDVRSLDANNQPKKASGTIRVTRDFWFEVWIDPEGREVQGEDLKQLRRKEAIFPPPPQPGRTGWKLKFQGYQHDDILTRSVNTDDQGEAEFTFTPGQEGYYRIAWTSQANEKSQPIKAETTVWVADNASTDLGYRHGGLEIIVDKDTFQTGRKVPVMLVTDSNDRHVLFSVGADDLSHFQVVHLTGTVKLVYLDITEEHVPNIFLNGFMVKDNKIFQDRKQVIVPPIKNFLNVTVEADKDLYLPREKGTLTVTALDHNQKPVSAEVALALVDESVYAIQSDLAGDPRQYFFGTKRQHHIATRSTFQMKQYRDRIQEEMRLRREMELRKSERGQFGGRLDDLKDAYQYKAKGMALQNNAPMSSSESFETSGMASDMVAEEAPPMKQVAGNKEGKMDQDIQQGSSVTVRSDFRTTVFWKPNIYTDKNGKARVEVTFPDSLTQWRATARTVTTDNHFGIHETQTRTRNPLTVRLQAPRFFVAGDELTLSALINNNTDQGMNVLPKLMAEGLTIVKRTQVSPQPIKNMAMIHVPARSEVRIDWLARAEKTGDAKIKVEVRGTKHSDAMEQRFVVHEHGIDKFVAQSGKVRGQTTVVSLDIPKVRQAESTRLTVQVTPSMAVTMLDALPYLIDFPYGCTEQTMSRFLPTVIVAKTLKDLGIKSDVVASRLFGGIDPQHTGKTHRKGKRELQQMMAMVEQGLDRLYDFQHPDGGWGWWKKGESDHFMTAYVLWGLVLAEQAGVDVHANVLLRAYNFLNQELVEEENHPDMQSWMLHAVSAYHHMIQFKQVDDFQAKAFDNLWKNRAQLNAYTRALLALSAHHYGDQARARTLVENLENGVQVDTRPDLSIIQQGIGSNHPGVMATAHWGEDGIYYRWSDGGVEATAFALRAMLTIDPKNKLIEPVMNWLVKNRRGAHWSNTRNTAITLLALTGYLKTSGELKPGQEYELSVNGTRVAKTKVENVLTAPSLYTIDPKLIRDGVNSIQIRRTGGQGALYFSAQAHFFSLEEPVTPAGNELFVRRQYFKLVGRPSLLKGYVYEKLPLNDGDTVTSGDRIETVLTIDAKNNYEYLVFEDLKPAGVEAVQLKSGEPVYIKELKWSAILEKFAPKPEKKAPVTGLDQYKLMKVVLPPELSPTDYTGRTRWVYQELRDRKVALFVDKLPQGVWEIRYTLRAEVPGHFHALPVLGHAMYIPEIRANGAETRITVVDRIR